MASVAVLKRKVAGKTLMVADTMIIVQICSTVGIVLE